jgi:acyl-coenzyme A thioesterase PaaI-like protein
MSQEAFQDLYTESFSYCYGCGRLNEYGHQIKSYWEGDEAICRFTPQPYHTAVPGYVYGGLIASLIDCHGTGTSAAAYARLQGLVPGREPYPRYVTASLKVDYLRPTPLGPELEVHARPVEIKGRKVVVEAWLIAAGEVTARGQVICVQVPEAMAGS